MSHDPTDNPADAAVEPARGEVVRTEAMGHKVGGGMTWMAVSAVVTRFATFLAQVLLGNLLFPEDFAIYGTATAIAGFLMVCRDMATGAIIVQRGREQYEQNAGTAFWLGFAYDMVVVLITLVLAWPIARWCKSEDLAPMLMVLALTLPFGAVANVLYSKLRLDLQFKAFSAISMISGFLRQVSMVLFAWAGFGHMSFAWPALVCIIIDCICLWWYTGDAVWMRSPRLSQWSNWVRDAFWLMFTSLANFAMDWGPYLVLAPLMGGENPIIGYYFFAYQITGQIGIMLAFNSTVVLTPALQKLNQEPRRQSAAALRALRTLMLAGSVASMGLAAIIRPLEQLLWHGKYAESVPALMILGTFYPWRITFGLTSSLLTAQGAFRRLTFLSVFECIGLMVAAGIAGAIHPTAAGIAWWTGGWVVISRLLATIYTFWKMGDSIWLVLRAVVPSWLVCLVALLAATQVARLGDPGAFAQSLLSGHVPEWLQSRAADLVRIGVLGGVCALVMAGLSRLVLHADLRDFISVAPARLRDPLQRVLFLRQPAPRAESN
jgi:O-antigen/teichoic acid export membrane protein